MYNQELKAEYISTIDDEERRKLFVTLFNATEKYEQNLESDVCTFPAENLLQVLNDITGSRQRSKGFRTNLLKRYIDWCINVRRYDGASDAIYHISKNDYGDEKIRNQFVANPNHLQTYLDCIYESEDEETIDCIYRCYFWLAFSGFDEDNLDKILCSDVDTENRVIRFGDREFLMYPESVRSFEKCSSLSYFVYKHPLYEPTKRPRSDGNELLRGIKAGVALYNMKTTVYRRQNYKEQWRGKSRNNPSIQMNLKLSYSRVYFSGLYYRQYEIEKAGGIVDFSQAAIDFMKDYDYKLSKSRNTIYAKRRQVERDYERDYERWKIAFSL